MWLTLPGQSQEWFWRIAEYCHLTSSVRNRSPAIPKHAHISIPIVSLIEIKKVIESLIRNAKFSDLSFLHADVDGVQQVGAVSVALGQFG